MANFLDDVIVGQPMIDRQGYFSFKEAGILRLSSAPWIASVTEGMSSLEAGRGFGSSFGNILKESVALALIRHFGSFKALSRDSFQELRRFLPQGKAEAVIAALSTRFYVMPV
jgi:hypothetical protein